MFQKWNVGMFSLENETFADQSNRYTVHVTTLYEIVQSSSEFQMQSLQALGAFFGGVFAAVDATALACGLHVVLDSVVTHAGGHRSCRTTKSTPG